jgi:uncharacterized repeat protein (TIGR03803 family)
LIIVNGTLYGTTKAGGSKDDGTVFSVTTNGTETVLHSFGTGEDGSAPQASLVDLNGTLYGTTNLGGANGGGVVFSITTSGKETVLHNFGGSGDGGYPGAGLVNVKGTLYGTTEGGGEYCESRSSGGCGTVFSVTTSGKETVLHSFGASRDGKDPQDGLINVKGTLYGTTCYGGAHKQGTIFSVTTSGLETVLRSFEGGKKDGYCPRGLVDLNGTLYGTTADGGKYATWGSPPNPGGTLFVFAP